MVRQQLVEHLACLLMRDALAEDGEHGVGTCDGPQEFGRVAHVDVISQSSGITIAGLHHSEIAREVQRGISHVLSRHGQPGEQTRILQFGGAWEDIHVPTSVGGDLGDFQRFQIARKSGLGDHDSLFGKAFGEFALAADTVPFDELHNELETVTFILHCIKNLMGLKIYLITIGFRRNAIS